VFIRPIPAEDATGAVAEMYEKDRRGWGFLPGYTQAFSHHPDAFAGWRQLVAAVQTQMDARRYELVTLAAARTVRSTSCAAAHSARLVDKWFDAATVATMVADHHAAGLDDVDVAIMDFAVAVASDPTSITAEDVDTLRSHGLNERDILDVVLAVAVRMFFTTVIEATAAGPDPEMLDPLAPELREAVLVGRRPQ
jgi:uncharacterized peroxidase-related enzyme